MFIDIYETKNKYNVIYADPPWKYNSRANSSTKFRGGAAGHYDLMPMKDIYKLPINNLANENCVLFLWTTFPCLKEQIKVFEEWGFRYITLGFSWIKTNAKNNKPFFGVGYYAKSNCECCLMGMKGQMKPVSNKISSCVISPRREHSRKPNEIQKYIVDLFGDVPRLELFSRDKKSGWDCWGNDVKIMD